MSVHSLLRARSTFLLHHAATLSVVLCTASCGGATTAVDDHTPDVAEVIVAPSSSTIVVGAVLPLQAVVHDAAGATLSGPAIVWSVQDTSVAVVSATGMLTARSVGTTQVAASANGRSGIATVTVQRAPVASVAVQPQSATIRRGETVRLSAAVAGSDGSPLADREVTWTSAANEVATVSASGLVTGVAPGTALVVATSETKADTATVIVVPVPVGSVVVQPTTAALVAGESTTLTVTVKDANGAVVADRGVAWSTSDALVASVSDGGVVQALAAGTATISATSEGSSGSAVVSVTLRPVASVSLQPTSATLKRGMTVALTATLKDASGSLLTGRLVTWSSSDAKIATVSPAGVVTAIALGSATISASSEGRSASASVTVAPGPVTEVRISPSSANVKTDRTLQLTATALDANGDVIAGASCSWQSSASWIASVSSSGVVRGERLGTVTITATCQGKTGSASIHVTK